MAEKLTAIEAASERMYRVVDSLGELKMVLCREGTRGDWTLRTIDGWVIDHDQYRHDVLERHGIEISYFRALASQPEPQEAQHVRE